MGSCGTPARSSRVSDNRQSAGRLLALQPGRSSITGTSGPPRHHTAPRPTSGYEPQVLRRRTVRGGGSTNTAPPVPSRPSAQLGASTSGPPAYAEQPALRTSRAGAVIPPAAAQIGYRSSRDSRAVTVCNEAPVWQDRCPAGQSRLLPPGLRWRPAALRRHRRLAVSQPPARAHLRLVTRCFTGTPHCRKPPPRPGLRGSPHQVAAGTCRLSVAGDVPVGDGAVGACWGEQEPARPAAAWEGRCRQDATGQRTVRSRGRILLAPRSVQGAHQAVPRPHPARFLNLSTWLTAIAGVAVLLLAYRLITGWSGRPGRFAHRSEIPGAALAYGAGPCRLPTAGIGFHPAGIRCRPLVDATECPVLTRVAACVPSPLRLARIADFRVHRG
jgi:hypothetical protein